MDNLPQIVINSEADHGEGGCKCSVMWKNFDLYVLIILASVSTVTGYWD